MKTLHVNDITPEALFEARRHFLKLGAGALVSSSALSQLMASLPKDLSLTYTPDTNPLKLTLNTEEQATNYVNFYEFSTDKTAPVKLSQKMKTSPWNVGFFGELKTEQMLEVDDLIAKFGLEERIYRFRCVEGWSMVVPWIGFPLYKLLDYLKPNTSSSPHAMNLPCFPTKPKVFLLPSNTPMLRAYVWMKHAIRSPSSLWECMANVCFRKMALLFVW